MFIWPFLKPISPHLSSPSVTMVDRRKASNSLKLSLSYQNLHLSSTLYPVPPPWWLYMCFHCFLSIRRQHKLHIRQSSYKGNRFNIEVVIAKKHVMSAQTIFTHMNPLKSRWITWTVWKWAFLSSFKPTIDDAGGPCTVLHLTVLSAFFKKPISVRTKMSFSPDMQIYCSA